MTDLSALTRTYWLPVSKFDPRVVGLFERHYSCRGKTDSGRKRIQTGILGPGESLVLLTVDCKALWAWIKEQYRKDGQRGVNCAVFRNESDILSSDLIKEAVEWAWQKWPGERLFTFVDSRKIRSVNPGACYLKAGWHRLLERTRGGLTILELLP